MSCPPRALVVILVLAGLLVPRTGSNAATGLPAVRTSATPVGSVTAVLQTGMLLRAGTSRNSAVTPFTPLYTGDRLSTSHKQRAAVLVKDGAQFLLSEQTNLGIDYPVLHLYHGEVFARIPHTGAYHVVVRTDAAVAAVQGTAFAISVGLSGGRSHTVLTVTSGSVRLSNRLGSVLVRAGQQASADPNKAPSQPVAVKTGVILQWVGNASLTTTIKVPPHFPTPGDAARAEQGARAILRAHPTDPDALLTLGDALIDCGAGSAARAAYKRALAGLSPADNVRRARAQTGIAAASVVVHDFAAADAAARAALALDPTNTQAALLRGDVAEARGDLTGSLARFTEILRTRPNDALVLEKQSFVLVLLHRLLAARAAAQAVLALQPPNWLRANAENDLALVEVLRGNPAGQLSYALRAVADDPHEPINWINVGAALLALGRYRDAIAPLTRASQIGASWQRAAALDNLGAAHAYLGQGPEALRTYAAAWKLDASDVTAAIGLGGQQNEANQHAAAVATLRRAMALAPHLSNVQIPYVQALYDSRAYRQAETVCRDALRDYPNDPNLLQLLAQVLSAREDRTGAARALQAAYAHRPSPDTADNALTAGLVALMAGHIAEARADLQRSVTLHPEGYLTWSTLALADIEDQRYQAAITAAMRAVALNTNAVLARQVLGQAYFELGQNKEAAAQYRAILRIDATRPIAHRRLASIALQRGDLTMARDEYLNEIRVQRLPVNSGAGVSQALAIDWQGLGLVYTQLQQLTKAIAAYRQAIRLDPTLYSAYDGLAFAQERAGDYTAALAAFAQAISRNPQDPTAYIYRGRLEALLGQLAVAERDLRQAVMLVPADPDVRLALGDVLRREGRYDQARAQLLQALQLARGTESEEQAWVSLGRLYDATSAYKQAASAYAAALKRDPGDLAARLAYGADLLRLHKAMAAREQFTRVVTRDPSNPAGYADLALADEQLGRTARAIEELQHQIAVNRGKRTLLASDFRVLGEIYAAHKRWHEAAGAFTRAVALGARSAQDYYDLGSAQARAGDQGNALRSLRTAQRLAEASGQTTLRAKICAVLAGLGAVC